MPRTARLFFCALAGLMVSGSALGQDRFRIQVFSAPEKRVVGVYEEFSFAVRGLAVPEDDSAAQELVRALNRMAFPADVSADFQVIEANAAAISRRAGTRIFEFYRRFTLEATHAGRLTIPPVVIPLNNVVAETRPQEILSYRETAGLIEARQNVLPVVAEVRSGTQEFRRIGSSFLIAPDALVTAYHVVIGSNRVRIRLPDGRRISTNKVWAIDPVRDVAILVVEPEPFERAGVRPLPIAGISSVEAGSFGSGSVVFTAGWPDGVQQATTGERFRELQFATGDRLGVSSNPVRPGDSGGPLLNEQGEVIGVVSSGRSTARDNKILREELCLAADPRRALAERMATSEPLSLRDALREAQREAPNGEVIQEAFSLTMAPQLGQATEDGLERIASAAERAPNDASLQFLAGSVFQAMGDNARAEASYQAALKGLEDYFPALYALGYLLYQRGEYDDAMALFRQTRSFGPYARLGALGLARVHTAQLRYADAATALAEVLDRDPDFAPAVYLLGYGHLGEGRIEWAEAIAVRLDRLDRGLADALRIHIRAPLLRPSAIRPLPRAEILANRAHLP